MKIYKTSEQILEKAETILNKSLREVVSSDVNEFIENQIDKYNSKRKGFLGDLIEKYFFEINPGNVSEPDFKDVDVELKTTPLKKDSKKNFSSKERLVFSMIDYNSIINEKWESSSFLKKNKSLLLMFYLWVQSQSILDYKFKFIHFLNLIDDISDEDKFQIQKDWENIVEKIKRGEAHLLSEGDTYYLGACTKAVNSSVVRNQPLSKTLAKPRAFSFKQQYINYLIQTKLLGQKLDTSSIFKKTRHIETIENTIREIFTPFIGKTDKEILHSLNYDLSQKVKSYKRLIVNKILGVKSNKIEELDKANVTLRVITLEHTGNLKESISFPAFDYKDLVTQVWYDEEKEIMSDFHSQLETKRFLFVVFQKQKGTKNIILKKTMFWNFPMQDIDKAKDVWETTVDLIKKGKIIKDEVTQKNGKIISHTYFPGISFNGVAHVRPHAKNKKDEIGLPVNDLFTGKNHFTKHCFWLNYKYIENAINEDKYKI